MKKLFAKLLFLVLNAIIVSADGPTFSDKYVVRGRILLPYAELNEPFTAYYDGLANKSRIDYYDDLQITVQRPDLGKFFKIAYTTRNGPSERVCFQNDDSAAESVAIQPALPDLSDFQLKKRDKCNNLLTFSIPSVEEVCEVWTKSLDKYGKKNEYTFILKRDSSDNPIPIYYLMMGYDDLMGSHYDKYEIIYESYSPRNVDSRTFDIFQKYECRGFPEGAKHALALMNPLREFINNEYDHIDYHFDAFTKRHNKIYTDHKETSKRKSIFLKNYRFIQSQNRKNKHFKLAVNHLADRTDEEIGQLRGRLQSNVGYNGGIAFNKAKYNLSKVPDQWDWRLAGAVTPVKDQAICGSCWSFGATGTIEGIYFVKTGRLLKLSQQQLIDCSWNENNNGCDGGLDFQTYNYLLNSGGIATEEDYGHYLGADGKCHDHAVKKSVQLKGFYNVTVNDPEAMKVALYYHGPVTIAIDASPPTFSFYSHGVYYDPNCKSNDLDHQVLAVGYGELNGEKYWLVKNSWSTYWGNDGYILINQKHNNCGVLSDATFPDIK